MINATLTCQTVSIVKELAVEKRVNPTTGMQEEKKSIFFKIATNRRYKETRYENGKQIIDTVSDFWLAKAYGNNAQLIADHCSALNAEGKLISRKLLLTGSFEMYDKEKSVTGTVQVNFGGQLYNMEVTLPVLYNKEVIFNVEKIEFLDKNPVKKENTQPAATVTPVINAPAPVQAGSQTTTAPTQVQPAASEAPTQAATTATPQAAGQEQFMNPPSAQPAQQAPTAATPAQATPATTAVPTVNQGFVPEGQQTPF